MPPTAADLPPFMPERIGKYEILLPIASGGMATVYLARVQGVGGFERDVALKLTHAHLLESPEFAVDLVEEAKLAARIRHPNVVATLDVGEDRLGVFLVMEYIEGDSLAGLRRRAARDSGGIPQRIALRIMLDSLAGLHEAHELRDRQGKLLDVVHRDFSPQNILIGTDGLARLTDFGVAKAVSRLGHTRTGLVKGKLPYMAPEQARGEPLDRRCDVWAAGVITWELLAGRRLYRESNDVAIVLKLVSETPPRLGTVVPGIAPALEQAVAAALTPERSARCPTAGALAQALRDAASAADGVAEREDCAEYVRRLVGSRIAKRQKRVDEVWRLRAKVDELSRQEREDCTLPTPSSERDLPVHALGADRALRRRPPRAELDDPSTDGAHEETTRVAAPADGAAAGAPDAAEQRASTAEHTRTDAISVATTASSHEIGSDRELALGSRRRRWLLGAGAAAALAIGMIVAVSTGGSGQAPASVEDSEHATAIASSAAATSPWTEDGPLAAASASASASAAASADTRSAGSVRVEANAPVASLRIAGHPAELGRPARRFTARTEELPLGETVPVEARSTDGRLVRTELRVGDEPLKIAFPPVARAGRPTAPASTPRPESPIPPSPYRGSP